MSQRSSMVSDLGRAVRSLRRRPGFPLAVVAILAVSMAATVAAFALARGTLQGSRWWADEERAVAVWPEYLFSRGQFTWLRDRASAFETLGGILRRPAVIQVDDRAQSLRSVSLSPELFAALRERPLLGRGLLPEDAQPGVEPVVVLGHGLWKRSFGGDPRVIDRLVEINGLQRRVVGVMPARAQQPGPRTEIWTPLVLDTADPDFWPARELTLMGILRPGISVDTARDDVRDVLGGHARQFSFFYRPDFGSDATIVAAVERTWEGVSTPLFLLLAGTCLLLMVAAVDVGHLSVARSLERQSELKVRTAVGATRGRIVRHLALEAGLLAAAAGLLGGIGAALLAPYLSALFAEATPVSTTAPTDGLLLGFLFGATVFAWLLMAGIPVAHFLGSVRRDLAPRQLRPGGPPWLVVAQAAMATVLLVTAGLLFRTVGELEEIGLGFEPETVSAVAVAPSTATRSFTATEAVRDAVAEAVAGQPGVAATGWISSVPLRDTVPTTPVNQEESPVEVAVAPRVARFVTDAAALEALGIEVLSGRGFRPGDRSGSLPVTLVNQAMAQALWPDLEPVGRRIAVDPHDWTSWMTVVGVVEDFRQSDLTSPPEPAYLVPRSQAPAAAMSLVVRSPMAPSAVTTTVRAALEVVAPDLPTAEGVGLATVVRDARGPAGILSSLLSLLAVLATLLGAAGLYGSLAAGVSRRRREIGTRMALGATPGSLSLAVLRHGLTLTFLGVLVGSGAGMIAGRSIRGLLFGISPFDPLAYAAPAVVLLIVGALGAAVPARRAAAVPPAQALRGGVL